MGTLITALVIGISGLVIGALGLGAAIWAIIQVEALKRATHTIEWLNPETLIKDEQSPSDKDLEKQAKREGLIPVDDDEEFENL